MPISKFLPNFPYYPCKKIWQHDYTILPWATMHAQKMNQISSLLLSFFSLLAVVFSTVLLTALNENTAKVKTPECGGAERHIYSHMWRVRPLQLITALHSFWVIGLASYWEGQMMHNPPATSYKVGFSRTLTLFPFSKLRCGTNTRDKWICRGLWF